MAVAHATVATNWVASIEQNEDFTPAKLRGSNVSAAGDRILSYHWWEMARIVRTRAGEPQFWLINGDTYSPSTSKHQSNVRSAISRSNLPKLIVPYTALDAAGIKRASITPLDVRDDRWEPYTRRAAELPESRSPRIESDGTATVMNAKWEYVQAHLDGDLWVWEDVRHWLGDSLFMATVREQRNRPAYEQRDRRAKFLSSFDYQESRPLYFLAELPRSNVETVDDAFELLKPPAVAAAMNSGLEVTRQGDIFAIPTSLTTRELKSIARDVGKRLALLGGTHQATEVIVTKNGDCYARGTLYHAPGEWRTSDHARRKIGNGKVWHRILKNTVPGFSRNGWIPTGTNSGAIRRGNVRAWSAGGSVD